MFLCVIINYLKFIFMETKNEKKLKKIQLIEEPKSEELLRKELEEALGGWNCGTYDNSWWNDNCAGYNNASCSDGSGALNYCYIYND